LWRANILQTTGFGYGAGRTVQLSNLELRKAKNMGRFKELLEKRWRNPGELRSSIDGQASRKVAMIF